MKASDLSSGDLLKLYYNGKIDVIWKIEKIENGKVYDIIISGKGNGQTSYIYIETWLEYANGENNNEGQIFRYEPSKFAKHKERMLAIHGN